MRYRQDSHAASVRSYRPQVAEGCAPRRHRTDVHFRAPGDALTHTDIQHTHTRTHTSDPASVFRDAPSTPPLGLVGALPILSTLPPCFGEKDSLLKVHRRGRAWRGAPNRATQRKPARRPLLTVDRAMATSVCRSLLTAASRGSTACCRRRRRPSRPSLPPSLRRHGQAALPDGGAPSAQARTQARTLSSARHCTPRAPLHAAHANFTARLVSCHPPFGLSAPGRARPGSKLDYEYPADVQCSAHDAASRRRPRGPARPVLALASKHHRQGMSEGHSTLAAVSQSGGGGPSAPPALPPPLDDMPCCCRPWRQSALGQTATGSARPRSARPGCTAAPAGVLGSPPESQAADKPDAARRRHAVRHARSQAGR